LREPEEETEEEIEEDRIEDGEKVLFINLEEEAWRREELSIRSRDKDLREAEENIPKEYTDFNNQGYIRKATRSIQMGPYYRVNTKRNIKRLQGVSIKYQKTRKTR